MPAYLGAFVALGWCRRGRFTGVLRARPAVALVLAVNLVSHPVLWAVALQLHSGWALVLAEAGVAAVEGLLVFVVVRRVPVPDPARHRLLWALFTAVVVNAWSVLVGVLVLPVVIGAA